MEHTKCLIIGSGPAGYTAAIYAGRANLQPIEYCGLQTGGQLTQTTIVENFPGYPEGVDANQMMMELREQAERFGADIRDGVVTAADLSKRPYIVTIDDDTQIETDTIIIATGASAKYLGLPDEQKYNGMGVSACATCDGFFYRKKVVAVVGGGDTACEEASYLANLCTKVYMIVRKPYLRASDIMRRRVEENPKIEILYEHNTEGLYGDNGVEGAHLVARRGEADERHYDPRYEGSDDAAGVAQHAAHEHFHHACRHARTEYHSESAAHSGCYDGADERIACALDTEQSGAHGSELAALDECGNARGEERHRHEETCGLDVEPKLRGYDKRWGHYRHEDGEKMLQGCKHSLDEWRTIVESVDYSFFLCGFHYVMFFSFNKYKNARIWFLLLSWEKKKAARAVVLSLSL